VRCDWLEEDKLIKAEGTSQTVEVELRGQLRDD
jgi:hypothetical protein